MCLAAAAASASPARCCLSPSSAALPRRLLYSLFVAPDIARSPPLRRCFPFHRMAQFWTQPSMGKNKALVDYLKQYGAIRTNKVAEVMETIDRALFVPEGAPYVDSPMPIGYNATISAPHMHATCLELLKDHLKPGMSALDVGSGSGYLTACFAMMVGPEGRAVGIDHIPELVADSIENVKRSAAAPLLKDGALSFHVAVADCFYNSQWIIRTRHLTSFRAENELQQLMGLLNQVQLSDQQDTRTVRFGKTNFSTKACYSALQFGGITCPVNPLIWKSFAPKKCKLFLWLAINNRLPTKKRLHSKNIVEDALCPHGCNLEENLTHMLFTCSFISGVWNFFNLRHLTNTDSLTKALLHPPLRARQLNKPDWVTIFLSIAWNIWLARNKKVHENANTPLLRIARNAGDTIRLWLHRPNQRRGDKMKQWLIQNENFPP